MNPASPETVSPHLPGWSVGAGPGLAWFVAFILLLVAALLVSTALRRRLGPAVIVLRVAAFTLLALLLFRPSLEWTRTVQRKPRLLVLVDRSASMTIADVHRDSVAFAKPEPDAADPYLSRWRAAGALLGRAGGGIDLLSRRFRVAVRLFPEEGEREVDPDPDTWGAADGPFTDIGRALTEATGSEGGADAVLLVSDGNHNYGPDPLAVAAGADVPVYPVPMGATFPAPEVEVVDLEAKETATLGDELTVKAAVRSRGLPGATTRLLLTEGETVLDSAAIELTEAEIDQQVELAFRPDRAGLHELTVTARPTSGERSAENNRRSLLLRVMPRKTRLLVFFGRPGFDLSFLLDRLGRMEDLEVNRLVQVGSGRFVGVDRSELDRLLKETDIILIGDSGRGDLPPDLLGRLADRLRNPAGIGLILFGTRTLSEAPEVFSALSPLTLPRGDLGRFVSVTLTPMGRLHLWAGGPVDPLAGLPPVWAPRGACRLTPEARVLVQVAPGGETAAPTVAYRRLGGVRVVAIALDQLWRWAFMPLGVGRQDDRFSEFWRYLIRWLSLPEEMKRLAVSPERLNFHSAEPVGFSAVLFDPDLLPIDRGEILLSWWREEAGADSLAVVASAGNSRGRIYLRRDEGAPGRYVGNIGTVPPGKYRYAAVAGRDGAEIGRVEGAFAVGAYSHEEANLPVNIGLLSRIAAATGGRLIDTDSLAGAAASIDPGSKRSRVAGHLDAPGGPAVLVSILLLLTLEWVLRRRRGIR